MRPTARLVWAVSALAIFGVLVSIEGSLLIPWIVVGLVVLALAISDRARASAYDVGTLQITRRQQQVVFRNVPSPYELVVSWTTARRPASLRVYEQLPKTIACDPYPALVSGDVFRRTGQAIVQSRLTAVQRGRWSIAGMWVSIPSPFGLWERSVEVDEQIRISVYPQLTESRRDDALLAARYQGGTTVTRKRGEGTEFHELREFVPGDPIRSVDWRSTAKRGMPIVRQFQDEQDQQVVMLLDAGYRLHQRDDTLLHFDYALEATLRLARASIAHGDSVGLLGLGPTELWIPPRKGRDALARILEGTMGFESSSVPSSPAVAVRSCLSRLRRRTLIVLLSNLREEDDGTMDAAFLLAMKRHVLMVASLREQSAQAPTTLSSHEDALLYASAAAYEEARLARQQAWQNRGILVVDCKPSGLSLSLINEYLRLKARGRL